MPKDFKIWIEITIPGFLYLLVGFFLFLLCFNINDLKFLKNTKDYLPYISILIIVLSSITGSLVYKVSEYLVYLLNKTKYNPKEEIKFVCKVPELLQTRFNDLYTVFVFYRLLIPGTFFLGVVLTIWLTCSEK